MTAKQLEEAAQQISKNLEPRITRLAKRVVLDVQEVVKQTHDKQGKPRPDYALLRGRVQNLVQTSLAYLIALQAIKEPKAK